MSGFMKKRFLVESLGALLLITGMASGQTNTFPINGNVGVGTLNPTAKLDVGDTAGNGTLETVLARLGEGNSVGDGTFLGVRSWSTQPPGTLGFSLEHHFYGQANSSLNFYRGGSTEGGFLTIATGTNTERMRIDAFGKIGVGTQNPAATLDIEGASDSSMPSLLVSDAGMAQLGVSSLAQFFEGASSTNNVLNLATMSASYTGTFSYWYTNTPATAAFNFITMRSGGNGTVFNINGNGNVFAAGGVTFADSTKQSTAWTGVLCGGDYAESVDVTGERAQYEPGDVLVIDPNNEGKFLKSFEPYSTAVLGVYSTTPGVTGRRQTTPKNSAEIPMAMVGIVPAKASTENGPIKPGDLLVTSSKPGYVMKGSDRSRLIGAVVGKAMAHLNSGTGVIEIAVTLQ